MRTVTFKCLGQAGLAAMMLVGLCTNGFAEETSPSQKGQEIAAQLCARCHSITRDGESPFAEAPPFRTFAHKWPLESLEEAFAEGIVVGHPAMPEFVFGPNDIQNLLSFMDSLSR